MTNQFTFKMPGGKSVTYKGVKITDLAVDPRYQRGLYKKHVKEMIKNLEPRGLKALIVSKRKDGKYYIIDGQQEWEVLKNQGWEIVPCAVHENLTLKEEAALFCIANNHKVVQHATQFRAALRAGDKTALAIAKTVENHDFMIPVKAGRPRLDDAQVINGIKTLVDIGKDNLNVLDNTLYVIRNGFETFPGEVPKEAIKDQFIRGVAKFIEQSSKNRVEIANTLKKKGANAEHIWTVCLALTKCSRRQLANKIFQEITFLVEGGMKQAA